MTTPQIILLFEALIFGMIVGSFLNVCIYRIPRNLTVLGRSFCPACGHMIPLWRNMPVFSWLLQGGKAACCGNRIHFLYPLVEMTSGILCVLTLWGVHTHSIASPFNGSHPLAVFLLWYLLLVAPLIVIFFIDAQHLIIPDVITLPGMIAGLGLQVFLQWPDFFAAIQFSGLGILVGGGSLLLVAEVVSRIKKRDALGGGDIKLAAMLGAFLGWKSLIFIFFVSSLIALSAMIAMRITRKSDLSQAIPFGPFIVLATFLYFLSGKFITTFYFQKIGAHVNIFFPNIVF